MRECETFGLNGDISEKWMYMFLCETVSIYIVYIIIGDENTKLNEQIYYCEVAGLSPMPHETSIGPQPPRGIAVELH